MIIPGFSVYESWGIPPPHFLYCFDVFEALQTWGETAPPRAGQLLKTARNLPGEHAFPMQATYTRHYFPSQIIPGPDIRRPETTCESPKPSAMQTSSPGHPPCLSRGAPRKAPIHALPLAPFCLTNPGASAVALRGVGHSPHMGSVKSFFQRH